LSHGVKSVVKACREAAQLSNDFVAGRLTATGYIPAVGSSRVGPFQKKAGDRQGGLSAPPGENPKARRQAGLAER
jgi:hypothetical protein